MLAYVLRFFQESFATPLPWEGDAAGFYRNEVTSDVGPVGGGFNDDGSIASYANYPGTSTIPELVGWTLFGWFMVCKSNLIRVLAAYRLA